MGFSRFWTKVKSLRERSRWVRRRELKNPKTKFSNYIVIPIETPKSENSEKASFWDFYWNSNRFWNFRFGIFQFKAPHSSWSLSKAFYFCSKLWRSYVVVGLFSVALRFQRQWAITKWSNCPRRGDKKSNQMKSGMTCSSELNHILTLQ